MKRGLLLVLLLIIFIGFVSAQGSLTNSTDNLKDIKNSIGGFSADQQKWDYLGGVWKSVMLNNSIIKRFDDLNRNINPAYFILFGENYDLSLTFLFIVLIWIAFFVTFHEMMVLFGPFSKLTSFASALVFAIIAAHLQIFSFFAGIIFKLFFFREGIWGLIWPLAFLVGIIIYIFISHWLLLRIKYFRIQMKRKRREERRKQEEEVLHETTESIIEGVKETNGSN